MAVRFTDRLGKGIRTAPRDALLAGSVSERRRGWAFGLHRAGDTAGAVVGLAVALGVLLASRGRGLGLDRGTFQLIVLLSLIPAVLAVLALVLVARDVPVQRSGASRPSLSLKQFDRPFLFFLGIMFVFTLGNSSDAFLILRAQNVGLTAAGILGMMLVFNLVYAGLSGPAGSLSDRWGRRRMLAAGWALYALVYVGFARAGAAWQVVGLMAVYGAFYGLTEGVARAFVADLVGADQRGTAYGVYHAAVGLAAFPASLIAGVLWQGVGSWAGAGAVGALLVRRRAGSGGHAAHGLDATAVGGGGYRLLKRAVSHVRRPVKRRQADTFLLITLLSFAAIGIAYPALLELDRLPPSGRG